MTPEQKYNEVVKAIQIACPDIMALVIGCRVLNNQKEPVFITGMSQDKYYTDVYGSLLSIDTHKVIGRDIYIGDVLRALEKALKEKWDGNSKENFWIGGDKKSFVGCNEILELVQLFDLKLPLSKQKPEVWAFLHELLIKDNK